MFNKTSVMKNKWLVFHEKQVELTIFSKYWARLQECYDFGVLLERTGDLFPRDELCHLFCQLPELLKVYMSIW